MEKFLSNIEKLALLPSEIQVRREEAFRLFELCAAAMDIRLTRVKSLPNIDRARREIEKQFRTG